jgi:hypothetical protein
MKERDWGSIGRAAQAGEKFYGIFAFDYEKGIVLELHMGRQHLGGVGIYMELPNLPKPVIIPQQTISRIQSVYKVDKIQ